MREKIIEAILSIKTWTCTALDQKLLTYLFSVSGSGRSCDGMAVVLATPMIYWSGKWEEDKCTEWFFHNKSKLY